MAGSNPQSGRPAEQARRRHDAGRLFRRLIAWLAGGVSSPRLTRAWVAGFIAAHAVLWTLILCVLKASQDLHFDTTEAYAWGQQFLWGYGKHPPVSGWIAGVWFRFLPVADWSAYALAMATLGFGLFVCWEIANRVVDRRRAFLTVVLLALYPIFNFKGFKYNADLAQIATLPLIVLAYLHAFEKRSLLAGLWLGLAAAVAVLTKYWAVTMIGAVGIAALLHPDRERFLRSPAPWTAMIVFMLAMLPHALWLREIGFAPFTYAGASYTLPSRFDAIVAASNFFTHHLALLAPMLIALVLVLSLRAPGSRRWLWWPGWIGPGGASTTHRAQALNIWSIQTTVIVGPMLGASLFGVFMKSDWGIPMFFLVPVAVLALPRIHVRRIAPIGALATWLVITPGALALAPWIAAETFRHNAQGLDYVRHSGVADQLTTAWRTRFATRWPVVASFTETSTRMTFYSPDHPAPLGLDEQWDSNLTSLDAARRSGFIGICDAADDRLAECTEWMQRHAAQAERMDISQRRFVNGAMGPRGVWHIYIVPPGR